MATENEFIQKSYYQTIIDQSNNNEHPITTLGKMYMEEMQKERPDLSSIRFAQGEVYFLNHDYEAAIYKWQHPLEESLIPWAQKNIADAHMEMGLFDYAERFYLDVQTQSVNLKSEVLLKLFSLYKQQGQQKKSVRTMKDAVQLNPDYANITEIARTYFEEIKDWNNAVELAVNEGIRTNSLSWFKILEGYAEQDLTSHYEPSYFNKALAALLPIDTYRFESLTVALWNSYKHSDDYIQWLEAINQLLLDHKVDPSYKWKKLPSLFEETYFDLISGKFLIKDISNLIQRHLANWLALSSHSDTLMSSTAILGWKETFPLELAATLVHEAEQQFEKSDPNQNGRQEGMKLLESIKLWAESEGLLDSFTEFIDPKLEAINMEVASLSEIRDVIKAAIAFMVDQRVELENVILEEINWNEDIQSELHQIRDQLGEMEKEKASIISKSFSDLKNNLVESVKNNLPSLLRNCSDLVKEDSDFSTLHVDVNDEMNKRIARYMEENVLQDFKLSFQKWIEDCEREFQDSQIRCHELSRGINEQYQEEKLVLEGDFKVLGDWQRDLERISRGLLRLEKVNILLRNNPSQLILKGARILLGNITKNNDLLHSRYKNYIENADYSDIAEEIINPFRQQLELIEESIEWDVNRFFTNPLEMLDRLVEEVQLNIAEHNDALNKMREKPEIYRDPLTLFELKLRQFELMNKIN